MMDDKLKQRLIGALVLVVAAVVFLPMLLSGQDETVSVEVEVPERPPLQTEEIASTAPIELPAQEPVTDIPEAELIPIPEEGAPVVTAPPATPAPEPAPAEPIATPSTPAAPSAPSAPAQGDWVVQLGSFSAASNANGFKEKLVTQGYNAYTVTASANGKEITRVYVGPVKDREAANRLRDELGRRNDAKGFVVAYDAASGKR